MTQLAECDRRLAEFAQRAPAAETEPRVLLRSLPSVGRVTTAILKTGQPDQHAVACTN